MDNFKEFNNNENGPEVDNESTGYADGVASENVNSENEGSSNYAEVLEGKLQTENIQEDSNTAADKNDEGNQVVIDLSGGYSKPDSSAETKGYTEIIKKAKTKSNKNRFIAAMLALTVLNLAILAGAFMVGKSYGAGEKQVASKQDLIENMKGSSSDNGMQNTVASQGELPTTEIAKKVGPAVVGITSTVQGQISIFGQTAAAKSEGSGIILSQDGYIVTNNHVVDGASNVTVLLNTGTEYEAKVIGADAQTDLAVIKIEPTENLTVATIGDSNNIEVGERAIAIGNPMGIEFFGSVTEGIISAVNRTVNVDNRTMNVIQTDAAINSGNSGGALINKYGEVIGINSIKVATSGVEGMGFAIPSSEAKPIIADLIEHGYVKGRPVIGISTRDVTEYMSKAYSWPQGVQVMEVTTEAAKSAGLQQGDIITEVDGEKITDSEALNKVKNQHNPGDKLKMQVYKYSTGRTETVEVTLTEQLPG